VVATLALWALAAAASSAAAARSEASEAAPAPGRDPIRLVLERLGGEPSSPLAFGVRGLPPAALTAGGELSDEDWATVWSVHVEREENAAILGDYRVTGDALWLVPAFPPEPGVRYRAVLRPAALAGRLGLDPPFEDAVAALASLARAEPVRADLGLEPSPIGAATRVEAAYPGADQVPENLLRFYLHFSAPMSRGDAYRWIRLEDAGGNVIEHPFLELPEELWDRDGRRLTLLLDPGRIKLGLRPRQEEGPALEAGHRILLAIDRRWPDAGGRPLAAPWRRGFRVGPVDRDPIDPSRWRLSAPRAVGRDALRVAFDEPLDHALLHRLLWIEDAAGGAVAGAIDTADGERAWSFVPAAPWGVGTYALRVDRRLEDLAGNRVGRPFEVDLDRPRPSPDSEPRDEPVRLPFTVSP
jgi:hypothetical protein